MFEDAPKICKKCGLPNSLSGFGKYSKSVCKKCFNERSREWAKNNKAKVKQSKLNWQNSQEGMKSWRDRHYQRTYGLNISEYERLLKEQGGGCKICGSTDPQNSRYSRLIVDHSHQTGEVRGIVCHYCNQLLRFAKDNEYVLERAIKYLQESEKTVVAV